MTHTTKSLYIAFGIVFVLLFTSECGVNGRNPGVLRGDTVLAIRFPITIKNVEGISLGTDHIVARSFVPLNEQTIVHTATAPDNLWNKLEQLQHDWCEKPPTFVPDESDEANFEVTFQCGYNQNPVYLIRPSELPEPFQELIDLVPSTTED